MATWRRLRAVQRPSRPALPFAFRGDIPKEAFRCLWKRTSESVLIKNSCGFWDCVGQTANGITGPDGGCGPAGVYLTCRGNEFPGELPGRITISLPILPGMPSSFDLALVGATGCGAENYSACYSNYILTLSLNQIEILDSKGDVVKGASLTAASGADYNPILEGFRGDGGPIIEPALGGMSVPMATEVAHLAGLKVATTT